VVRAIVGIVGAALVTTGFAFIYWPAGIIVAGAFLLWADRATS
jgi:hypothetical protein